MNVDAILKNEFENLKNDLIKQYDLQNMRATGNTAESLVVLNSTNRVQLIGSSVWEQLEYGRRPTRKGGAKGSGTLIGIIKQWIKDKNIVAKGKISQSTLAFLITRKIHRDGWNRSKHGGVDVVSKVVTINRIQQMIDKIGVVITLGIVKKLEKELITLTK